MTLIRKVELLVGLVAVLAIGLVAVVDAKPGVVKDRIGETKWLKKKPVLDIVRAKASNAVGDRVKHKVTMRAKLKPRKSNTRPFILINTKGGKTSDFEYLALGRRLFEKKGKKFNKVGAVQMTTRKRTWVYRFKVKKLGVSDSYDWAALTAKGKTRDLAPNRRYIGHDLP